MSRLPNLTSRDELPAGLAETYDRIAELRGGQLSGPYGILIHSPELAERAAGLSRYVRWNSDLTPGQRETAIIVAARELDAELMWNAHVRLAREGGVREAVIEGDRASHRPRRARTRGGGDRALRARALRRQSRQR